MSESAWICEDCHTQFVWIPQLGFLSTGLVPVIMGAWPVAGLPTRPEYCPKCGSKNIDQSEG